ncbi:DUF5706 domain-containing protein [Actinoallomurus purpureus]|uniref:Pycsar system effector family protein n=1 Tax=Actinoallomurus purpureus TaxID=478114 RepID=UPI0020932DDD|nr:Pycsar system effector family protein [Actinoallomurus purpureus]MCO6011481.1 DUF5706 domain-containing protein [Actinoallomurus purpureus]
MIPTATTLTSELAAVRNELSRVDAKCGTLTALTGAGMLALITTLTGGKAHHDAAWWCSWFATLFLAAATITLLSVLRPRLGSTGFRRYAYMDPGQIQRLLTELHPAVVESEDLMVLSQIVNRKYLALRRAVDLTMFAAAVIALALVVGVVA